MEQRNNYNSEFRRLVSHRQKGLCSSIPKANTYINSTSESTTNNTSESVSQLHTSQVNEYYDKYRYEVVLTYNKKSMTLVDRKKSLGKFVSKLYEKLYGRHNLDGLTFDYYAVLESKDKLKSQTHFHWHLLVCLCDDRKHWDLNQQFADEHLCWKHGEMWVRDKPLHDPYGYITDYLGKDKDAFHYQGE